MMAADESFRNVAQFLDGKEMLAKLGPDSTLVKFGGNVVAKPLGPENLDECPDFDQYVRNNSISESDVKKAKSYYAKLGLSIE